MTSHKQLGGPQRRSVLMAGAAAAALACMKPASASAPFQWERVSPGAEGMAPDFAARLDQGVKSGEIANLHAVFVARKGKMEVERYFEGRDERWGTPLGTVAFNANTLHDVRSISKSVVGLLYGIALAEGKVPGLDTPVLDAFPAYPDLAKDERRRQIRLSHVLSMTMGLEWNEDLPYSDPRNSEIAMEHSKDRYRYVLERPIVAKPGERWRYSGGATAVLGHLIAKGTGTPLLRYAREKLFSPMGIDNVEWTQGFNGEAAAASGLRMRAPDLARIGQLLLQRGEWNGRALVSKDWISESLAPRADSFDGLKYGYQWYVVQRRDGSPGYMGIGLGGQRLVVVPALELVYVIFMGNYYREDQVKQVFAVQNLIHASLR
jgi:CubicO group peptidase (beta-lactamase class C family)